MPSNQINNTIIMYIRIKLSIVIPRYICFIFIYFQIKLNKNMKLMHIVRGTMKLMHIVRGTMKLMHIVQAVRETNVSRHQGSPIEGPPETSRVSQELEV